jgi:transketolase
MPVAELFDQQPKEYQDKVLGKGLRVSVEAATTLGW